jgi:hypothetical protein
LLRPKNSGPDQCVPVMWRATAVRLLKVAPLVLKQPLGGDRHPVLALAPFAQQDRARREIELGGGPQLDLGVFAPMASRRCLVSGARPPKASSCSL